jgi:nucleoside-diphosphate-sugar epimerase
MKKIVVLGSAGQIGSPLSKYLKSIGLEVLGLDITQSVDEDLRIYNNRKLTDALLDADFCFFLAFDVGGSHYLETFQNSYNFMQNNLDIMSNVFRSLEIRKIPFVFASSQMANMSFSNYGILKNIGERITDSLGGITVKFWNVYGLETDPKKYHAISDFVRMGLTEKVIRVRTDGSEVRDFLYVDDCCTGLNKIMESFYELRAKKTIDLASGHWLTIRQVAQIIGDQIGVKVFFDERKDAVQNFVRNNPQISHLNGIWSPTTTIEKGIEKIINGMKNYPH